MDAEFSKQRQKFHQSLKEGSNREASQKWYSKHATVFEEHHQNRSIYRYPKECAKILSKKGIQKDCTFIDFAMGTGAMGEMLREEGFEGQIDGLDRNATLLQIAKTKGIYTNIWETDIGAEKIECINDDSYDHGIAGSCIGKGQVEFDHIPTMIRTIRAGGYLLITMNNFHLQFDEFSPTALRSKCHIWEENGLCCLEEVSEIMHTSEENGHAFVLRKCGQTKN